MKQHITVDDLNELSDKGKEKLRAWWKPQWGDFATGYSDSELSKFAVTNGENPSLVVEPKDVEHQFPLLSIGQMIEFIEDHREGDEMLFPWWNKLFTWNYGSVDGPEGEFCDALWGATRDILVDESYRMSIYTKE